MTFVPLYPEETGSEITPNGGTSFKRLTPTAPKIEQSSWQQKVNKIADIPPNFAIGMGKGVLSTVKGLSDIGQNVARTVTRPIIGGAAEKNEGDVRFQEFVEPFITPKGNAQKAGFIAEQLAEFALPATKLAKGEMVIDALSQGVRSPLLSSGARILGKSTLQGLGAGGVRLAQTGGDVEESAKTGLTAGLARGAFATIGEGARALRIPERLYQMIFKNTAKDMVSELKADGLYKLQQTNPARFDDFVKKGIIQVEEGRPVLNETLAEQALDRGLRGSIRTMASKVVDGTLQAEDDVRRIAKTYTGTINMTEPQFKNVLKGIAQEYEDVGFGEISRQASKLANEIEHTKGNVTGEVALEIRRLLDRARIARSFEVPAGKLSLSQQNLKTLADSARERLNSIPGMGETMKDYTFYIEALESLAREAARRGNNQVLSLIDSIFLAGGFGGNNIAPGLTAGIGRRIFMSGPGLTYPASALRSGTFSPGTSAALSGGSSALQSSTGDPQDPTMLEPQPQQ